MYFVYFVVNTVLYFVVKYIVFLWFLRGSCSRSMHYVNHIPDRLSDADQQTPADDSGADVDTFHMRQPRNFRDVLRNGLTVSFPAGACRVAVRQDRVEVLKASSVEHGLGCGGLS